MPRFRLSAILFSLAVMLSIPAPVEFGSTGGNNNFVIENLLTPAVAPPTNVAVTGTIFLLGYGIAGVAFGRRLRR